MVLFGADRVSEYAEFFQGRVALLTAPTGRTRDNRSTIDVLKACCDLRLLLAPEHGVRGDKPAGAVIADEIDGESGLPACSLYGKDFSELCQALLQAQREKTEGYPFEIKSLIFSFF